MSVFVAAGFYAKYEEKFNNDDGQNRISLVTCIIVQSNLAFAFNPPLKRSGQPPFSNGWPDPEAESPKLTYLLLVTGKTMKTSNVTD